MINDIIWWQVSLYELINIWIPGFIFVFLAYRVGRGKIKSGGGTVSIKIRPDFEENIVCKIDDIPSLYIKELEENDNCFEKMNNIWNNVSNTLLSVIPGRPKPATKLKIYDKKLQCDEIFAILIKNNYEITSCIQTDPTNKFLIIKKKY